MAPGSVAVIVGASRGIGKELAKIYLGKSDLHIVALSRNAQEARKAIVGSDKDEERLTAIDVDIKQEDSIHQASQDVRKRFGDDCLRLLFNVAGILQVEKNIQQVQMDEVYQQFQINTFAPLLTAKHFYPLLPRRLELGDQDGGAKGLLPRNTSIIANMSARVGSISDNRRGGWYGYRSSKAAQNQITRSLALELQMRKTPALCVGLHPGTVRTELSAPFTGGPGGHKKPGQAESEEDRKARGEFEADEAAQNLVNVLANLKPEQSGYVWDHAGKQVPA